MRSNHNEPSIQKMSQKLQRYRNMNWMSKDESDTEMILTASANPNLPLLSVCLPLNLTTVRLWSIHFLNVIATKRQTDWEPVTHKLSAIMCCQLNDISQLLHDRLAQNHHPWLHQNWLASSPNLTPHTTRWHAPFSRTKECLRYQSGLAGATTPSDS